MYTMWPLKWPLTLRLLPIRAAILDFRWAIYFHLMQYFVGGTYSGKVIKTPLHLYRFQRYEHEGGLGGNFTPPPPPLDIGGLSEVDKTIVFCVMFLPDVACQKLLISANVARGYSKNNTGIVFWDTVYCRNYYVLTFNTYTIICVL